MNKKLMAIAVAGALAAPAVAFAQANVEIYGRANLGLDTYSATGATAGSAADLKSRTRVYDSGSRIGFRGTENLGGGLKALFAIESGVNIDTGSVNGQAGTQNASAGTLGSRDSYVGLEGSMGRVTFGRQSIFWVNGPHGQTGANHINTDIGWYNGAAFTGVARVSNVMAYTSPTVSGWNATASYAPNSETAVGGANTDARIVGLTVRKTSGPIDAQYDYTANRAVSGGANQLTRSAHKFNVGYPYAPGSRVSVIYLTSLQDNTSADDIKQKFWGVNLEHALGGPWVAYAMYSKVGNKSGCSTPAAQAATCDNSGATGYLLALRYNYSKRTWIYTSYNATTNQSASAQDYTGANYTSAATALVNGADPKIFAVGIRHDF
jgi:predicted porin